jgi:hypothetical protein
LLRSTCTCPRTRIRIQFFRFELTGKVMSSLQVGAHSFAAFSGHGPHRNRRENAFVKGSGPIQRDRLVAAKAASRSIPQRTFAPRRRQSVRIRLLYPCEPTQGLRNGCRAVKPAKHFLLPTAAALLISAALTAYWYQQSGAFPHTLSELGNWVIDSLGDASADAEAIYVALVSLLLALLLVSAVTMIMRRFRGSEMGHAATLSVPSGRGGVESAPHQ